MVTGNYIYVAGQLPMVDGEIAYKGKVPSQRSEEEAYKSARACGLNIIAQVNAPTRPGSQHEFGVASYTSVMVPCA